MAPPPSEVSPALPRPGGASPPPYLLPPTAAPSLVLNAPLALPGRASPAARRPAGILWRPGPASRRGGCRSPGEERNSSRIGTNGGYCRALPAAAAIMTAFRRSRVAVLAADVAGYTRLMEEREEDTHARLMRVLETVIRPALAERGGSLVKSTGDGFLAAFPEIEGAADAAMAIQAAAARLLAEDLAAPPLLFRMGVTLTDAIIEAHDIFGEGVNLAARLQSAAEPGGILLSSEAAEALRGRPGLALAELGEIALKNIARPVRAFALRAASGAPAAPVPPAPATLLRGPGDGRPSIAVLPFRTRPGDEEDGYFAEGVIEGILHVLAGIETLFVIARGSTQAYAGKSTDPREVAAALGVRYVLSGSAQRAGSRLRIATELADAVTGTVVRADRHDGALTDLFEMQDRIALDIVAAIAPAVRDAELQRALQKHPDSMTAHDHLLRALTLCYRTDRESFDLARGCFQQAMAESPGWGAPRAHAAHWHIIRVSQGWSTDPDGDFREAGRLAAAAAERDPSNALALAIQAHALSFARKAHDEAAGLLERALRAGPSVPLVRALASYNHGWRGDWRGGLAHAEQALRLSPLDPFVYFFENAIAQAHYIGGDHATAVAWGRRALAGNPSFVSNLRTLIAACVGYGDLEAARRVAARLRAVHPDFDLTHFAARTPLSGEILETFVARLRAAGLPD
jgi:adenylate cyclase